jgi:amino acid adenylation domain-containing protein
MIPIIDENNLLTSARFKKQGDFWIDKLSSISDKEETNLLFTSRKYTSAQKDRRQIDFYLPHGLVQQIVKLSKKSDLFIYILLLVGLKSLIYRYTGNKDIFVVSPLYQPDVSDETINDVLLILDTLYEEMNFMDLVMMVRQTLLDAYENQDYPFDRLAEACLSPRQLANNPFMTTVACVFENIHDYNEKLAARLKDQVIFLFRLDKSRMSCSIIFDSGRYESYYIEKIPGHFTSILEQSVNDINIKISEIIYLTEQEKKCLLYDYSNREYRYPAEPACYKLFERQVEKTPDKVALVYKDSYLTYRELDECSLRLAVILRESGFTTGSIAALMIEPSFFMIVGLMGILKAGGVFLPIGADYPEERIDYMLKDSKAEILLAVPATQIKVKEKKELIDISELPSPSTSTLTSQVNSTNLAYIIYTSGSTGQPKGVLITHRNLTPMLLWSRDYFGLGEHSRVLQNLSYTFDFGVFELLTTIIFGGTLYFFNRAALTDVLEYSAFINDHQINTLHTTPSFLSSILSSGERMSSLRILHLGGERLSGTLIDTAACQLSPGCSIYNGYGPTETTINSSIFKVGLEMVMSYLNSNKTSDNIPIGKPSANNIIYILDSRRRLVPIGAAGELYIGGSGVALGYLNRPELTAKKFIDCKCYMSSRIYRFYRTGDLARWLEDGNIDFLGRIDQQIKIRGFRVELGEIENRLLGHDVVKEAVVVANEDKDGNLYLSAYVVSDKKLVARELREYLACGLPDYMNPSYFIQLEKIPLTSSGKIDRKALPPPDISIGKAIEFEMAPPETEVEKKLAGIWSEVLNIDKDMIGIDTSFFYLGGHSLKAINLISGIHEKLKIKMKLTEVFEMKTIRRMAKFAVGAQKDKYAAVPEASLKDYYPLSPAQKRMFILHRMASNSPVYNVPQIIPLEGDLDTGTVQSVFSKLIERHESLRTSFHLLDGEPVQRIHDAFEIEIEVKTDDHDRLYHFIRPFDLSKVPLLRVGLIKQVEKTSILVMDMHHIITDGISVEILTRELMLLAEGKGLPALRIQYKDYSEWVNSREQKEALRIQEDYWLKEFAGELPVLDLPWDYPRSVVQSFEGQNIYFEPGETITAKLNHLAEECSATLYMVLLAVFTVLLSRLSGQEDIIVGTPTSGRRHANLEHIVGMFVSTLAVRSQPVGEKTFKEYLSGLKDVTLLAFENQDYPFEDMVENLSIERDSSRNPIFDVMFSWHTLTGANTKTNRNMHAHPQNWERKSKPTGEAGVYDLGHKISKFDMTLIGFEEEETTTFIFEYCAKLFKRKSIQRFIGYFKNIITSVLENEHREISRIDILSKEEKHQLLVDFSNAEAKYLKYMPIDQLLEKQINKSHRKVAVAAQSCLQVTYGELNKRAGKLVELIRKIIGKRSCVGIMFKDNPHLLSAILGVIKSSNWLVPIAPNYPDKRIGFMVNDCGIKLLLTDKTNDERARKIKDDNPSIRSLFCIHDFGVDVYTGEIQEIDFQDNEPKCNEQEFGTARPDPGHACYIIYTSGSTGWSKGVPITQENLTPLLLWFRDYFGLGESTRVLQSLSYSFDFGTFEILTTLLFGSTLFQLNRESLLNSAKYVEAINLHGIDTIHTTPSFFRNIISIGKKISGLRIIHLGGEILTANMVIELSRLVSPDCMIYNGYGPTEATVNSSIFALRAGDATKIMAEEMPAIPIGKPSANNIIYILDKFDHLQPVGVGGELCISGRGVSMGYLNQPELTAEKFDQDLWDYQDYQDEKPKQTIKQKFFGGSRGTIFLKSSPGHRRLYKTGDLARWLVDGNIEFLGRIDQQIKIRGFRVELGEIENRLLGHGAVKEVVVMANENKYRDKYLCAYYVFDRKSDAQELREYLARVLPDYMIPSYFVQLDKMPLNPNGKIDIRALPVPEISWKKKFLPPETDTEKKLVDIWSEVLVIDKDAIGIDANFFHLGGHSLKAIQVLSRIEKELHVEMGQMDLFQHPALRSLAKAVEHGNKTTTMEIIKPREEQDYYELSHAQKSLWLHSLLEEEGILYNIPVAYTIEGDLDREAFEQALQMVIKKHEVLGARFVVEGGLPKQKFDNIFDLSIYLHYLDLMEELRFEKRVAERIINEMMIPFDLYRGPLLRAALVRLGEKRHVFFFIIHHLIFDGLSLPIFMSQLLTSYTGFFKGNSSSLNDLRVQYRDYAIWQNRLLSSECLTTYRNYWLVQLTSKSKIPVLALPMNKPRPEVRSFDGQIMEFEIDSELVKAACRLSKNENVTPFITFLTALYVLLHKYSGQEDIIIGVDSAGRTHEDLEELIGLFVNTLPIRIILKPEETFLELLQKVKTIVLGAFDHQEYPFNLLVADLKIKRETSRSPLFDVNISWHIAENDYLENEYLKVKPFPTTFIKTHFDLCFNFQAVKAKDKNERKILVLLSYSTDLFDSGYIELMRLRFLALLKSISQNPEFRIADLEFKIEMEKKYKESIELDFDF